MLDVILRVIEADELQRRGDGFNEISVANGGGSGHVRKELIGAIESIQPEIMSADEGRRP